MPNGKRPRYRKTNTKRVNMRSSSSTESNIPMGFGTVSYNTSSFSGCSPGWAWSSSARRETHGISLVGWVLGATMSLMPYFRCLLLNSETTGRRLASYSTASTGAD